MIENPVGPVASIPLERAFIPLHLLSQNQRELIELFPYAATQPRIMVLGGPGTGKTTLMKHLIIAIIRYLETGNFAIPQSRNRFYKECIDELLVKRPARCGITLDFTRDDKLAVLQRVSLDRLESVQEWIDARGCDGTLEVLG